MWPRMQPATLLTLALCSLLLHPALGFPSARQTLAKSARGDDLISGSDFLSVFIGATVPRTRPRSRNYKINKRPDYVALEESITRTSYFDDISGSSESSFGTRTIPKGGYPLPAESLARSSSVLREPDISQTDSEQDIFGEVSTRPAGSSTAITDEIDVFNRKEPQKFLHENTPLIGVSAQDEGAEPFGESSITNSKRIEYISKTPTDKESDSAGNPEQDLEKGDVAIISTSSPNSETLDLNANLTTVISQLEQNSSTVLNTSSESEAVNNSSNIDPQIQNEYSNNNHDSLDSISNPKYNDEENVSTPPDWSSRYFTTEEDTTQDPNNETLQVISVRVSSSVAHIPAQQNNKIDNDSKDIFTTLLDPISQSPEKEINSPSIESVSLVTEEQPAATAVQRSQFSVEEASPSSSVISVHQESSSSNIQPQNNAFTSSGSIESPVDPQSSPVSYHTSISTATSGSRVQFYSEPPSYHRSASSVAETIQRAVIAQQQQPPPPQEQSYGQVASTFQKTGRLGVNNQEHPNESTYDSSKQTESNYQTSNPQIKSIAERLNGGFEQQNQDAQSRSEHVFQTDTNRAQKSYEVHHQEPQERNYELPEEIYVTPEKAYSAPEQNYEVDESVSVMTNGRAHGVQFPSVTTPAQEPDTAIREFHAEEGQTRDSNSKFGYVVEGRNYRKYQVEERTPDGFIVGEYGVVRHDDGSLRGVRYTADGTTSPRLIYEALINFLKL